MIVRHTVPSSNVAEIGYDADSRTLEVMFRNGAVYQYFEVPQAVWEELDRASSAGSYLNSVIKGAYRYARL